MGVLVFGFEVGDFSMWWCMVSSGGSILWALGWEFFGEVRVEV